ncbi:peroxisomal membrane protein PMP34 isoform X2 [Bombina bombina]|uniref:peroxisomal membrane protein PMP34 isoform X2 n=1 Tax=Bombina bombina TaxID=8345 RepID=UPI00235A6F28|nr:peroxisomal membrane protein PMP34 isoform X2 [Bombina bombina]
MEKLRDVQQMERIMGAVFSYGNLVHAVSGAVGSVTAMTLFFPLDTARLRLQVDEKRKSRSTPAVLMEIIKDEGILAPYRGVVNVLLTTPLWVVNTRLKLQGAKFRNEDIVPTTYTGIGDAFRKILREEGLMAFWNGTFPSLLLVFNPAIQFMFYEGLKRHLLRGQTELSALEIFVIGAIAKAIATTLTYPLQTVQSILRFSKVNVSVEKKRFASVRNVVYLLQQRVRRLGFLGLYKGLEAKLLQTILTAALMFLVYEKMSSFTFRIMGLQKS